MNILQLNAVQLKEYFLLPDVYCSISLPKYYDFTSILLEVDKKMTGSNFENFENKKNAMSRVESNAIISFNKDGNYQWRKLSIINPFSYIDLVKTLTEEDNWEFIKQRFEYFQENKKIICCSIPIVHSKNNKGETISNLWEQFEQKVISISSEYNVMGITDISNCYSSIYTHSIAWALHDKNVAKFQRGPSQLFGNKIDYIIQRMSNGQTNGIPEGSVIMDFIGEIVLGYADVLLSNELKESRVDDYKIVRFRDDYRIFSHNKSDIDTIMKKLSEVLLELNLKLNADKTFITTNVLEHAITPDKYYMLTHNIPTTGIQKRLYSIWKLSHMFPGCRTVHNELKRVYKHLLTRKHEPKNIEQLVAIIINIMYTSSKYYPICISCLSKLVSLGYDAHRLKNEISKKFKNMPNTGYLDIWLQRLTIKIDASIQYECSLCNKIDNPEMRIWNWEWFGGKIHENIINEKVFDEMNPILTIDETSIFDYY